MITMTVPVPLGVMTPSLSIGAALGYLVGIGCSYIPKTVGLPIDPNLLAMVGAGAFASGLTHRLSSAIMVVEFTGDIYVLFPAMVCLNPTPCTCNTLIVLVGPF